MSIGAQLELTQRQSMKLAPSQVQAVEILQMNALELKDRISSELLENPVLEIEYNSSAPEIGDLLEYSDNRDEGYDDFDTWDGTWSDTVNIVSRDYCGSGAADYEKYVHAEKTLHEHLMDQLSGVRCSEDVRKAAEIVIYSLDSNGYLETGIEEISQNHGIEPAAVGEAIDIVRRFDPYGIGYMTLQECLKSQLDESDALYEKTCSVIDAMLREVARGDYKSISESVSVTQDQAVEICRNIRLLEPKPGMRFSDGTAIQYVVPDVNVELDHGRAYISVYGTQPHLTINEYYKNLFETSEEGEVKDYLKDKIDKVNLLIDNISRRNTTLINVTRSILKHQEHFLNPGNRVLLPLTMQQIADDLGVSVSTVSRAVSGKYLMLAGSTYSLKYFFSSDVNGASRDEILSVIRRIIDDENPAKPLSDQKIAEKLNDAGFDISRRTVAKYRDQAGILPKNLRTKKQHK